MLSLGLLTSEKNLQGIIIIIIIIIICMSLSLNSWSGDLQCFARWTILQKSDILEELNIEAVDANVDIYHNKLT